MVQTVAILKSYNIWMHQAPRLLEKYGYTFPSPVGVWEKLTGPLCPECNGYPTMEDSKGNWIYCVCALSRWLDTHKNDCQLFETPVPAVSLDDLKPFSNHNSPKKGEEDLRVLLSFVRKWMQRPRRWMWIEGGTGTGKSHVLMAIKTALPKIAFYIGAERFSSECFRTMEHKVLTEGGDEVTLDDFITRLSTVPILLFDDWGLEHRTSFVTDQLAAVINNRVRFPDEFVTIVTSNMQLAKLLHSGDQAIERIASRMSDSQYCDFFTLSQADYRRPTTFAEGSGYAQR
jgi:DNA replication protein DnaC